MKRKYTSTELGMMYGLLIGAVIGVALMIVTGQAWWLVLAGAGLALGFGLGATWDTRGA